jgi:hypothetical protein
MPWRVRELRPESGDRRLETESIKTGNLKPET